MVVLVDKGIYEKSLCKSKVKGQTFMLISSHVTNSGI